MTSKIKATPLTIVIKLGTSSIVSPEYPFLPHLELLSSIVETVVHLRSLGHRVVLCSSGAIGVGLRRMNLRGRGKALSQKQALAAIGQGRLIALWDNLFSQLDQPIAQILLTRMDISDRTRYLNAQNTFSELLQMGVVPIVNENDTVSVTEIKFGDNDTLSAISSAIVHADYLFLLTDVECLYTDNPRNNPDAKPVRVVRDIEKVKQQVSTATLGTSLGTGGMSTKLIAAELATAAGTTTVIMHSANVKDIFRVIEKGAGPSRDISETPYLEEGPLCTRFLRRETALKDRKWWIAHGLHSAGTIVIDEGAYRAIQRKESGGRLLPAGVVRVEGPFASHQAVRLIVRRRRRDHHHHHHRLENERNENTDGGVSRNSIDVDESVPPSPTRGSTSTSRFSIDDTSNKPSTLISPALKHLAGAGVGGEPSTPQLQPILSLSSSIASLDPLSKSIPSSPSPATILSMSNSSINERLDKISLNDTEQRDKKREEEEGQGWEEVEIGKGLAQYNSVEIDRIKGLKSAHIETVLGYSESEHVVDSITFL
ncbi:glutamate 5-kinase [Kwoniella dejecticola CBS 10117]|uniref:Glutamate 5-kinase n=1 Tax=Kwoniella dejecticola CBS 10117 TaxID=1296121 RepID=A0A1A6AG93_9TREE|nr:glutamate 5-kinase [Kwoniella dejecticola CBS 10117]OBR89095.1 glutamate 5-kinase [Kwoniella dejecticola CBS 10117]